jgi:hypothetical protein
MKENWSAMDILQTCFKQINFWRHDSVLNYIAGCLKSALAAKSTVALYCDLDGLQAPGGGSIPADVGQCMVGIG